MPGSTESAAKTVWAHVVALPPPGCATSVGLPLALSPLQWVNSKIHFAVVGLTHVPAHTCTYTHAGHLQWFLAC